MVNSRVRSISRMSCRNIGNRCASLLNQWAALWVEVNCYWNLRNISVRKVCYLETINHPKLRRQNVSFYRDTFDVDNSDISLISCSKGNHCPVFFCLLFADFTALHYFKAFRLSNITAKWLLIKDGQDCFAYCCTFWIKC